MERRLKALKWVGASKKNLIGFPPPVRKEMGYALYLAQLGMKGNSAKPLRGFGGAGVVEVVESHDGSTYRAVYTVKFEDLVFVLHAFQKKSKKGIATPQADIRLIRTRLDAARQLAEALKEKNDEKQHEH